MSGVTQSAQNLCVKRVSVTWCERLDWQNKDAWWGRSGSSHPSVEQACLGVRCASVIMTENGFVCDHCDKVSSPCCSSVALPWGFELQQAAVFLARMYPCSEHN